MLVEGERHPEVCNNIFVWDKHVISSPIIIGHARLGEFSSASLLIPANDDPYGSFTFLTPKIYAHEDNRLLKVTVTREGGLFGSVSVAYHTESITAMYFEGKNTVIGVEDVFNVANFRCSHVFQHRESMFLLIVADHLSSLFLWKGGFVKLKVSYIW